MNPAVPAAATELAPANAQHLLYRLALLEGQVRAAVEARRVVDPTPDDAFRGLYITDADIERLLAGGWPQVPAIPDEVADAARRVDAAASLGSKERGASRLAQLKERFGLTTLDLDLLVVALAPDLDARFERLYGYLNDDVTRRRATIGLALELVQRRTFDAEGRARLSPGAPLVDDGLVVVDESDRPFLTRSLRVPDRVAAHLLGDDAPHTSLVGAIAPFAPPVSLDAGPLSQALAAGAKLVYLREQPGSAGRSLAIEALRLHGLTALSIDLSRLEPETDIAALARTAGREALLRGSGLVVGPIDALGEPSAPRERAAIRSFAELNGVVMLFGRPGWDPLWSSTVPVVVEAPTPDDSHRAQAWLSGLGDAAIAEEEIATAVASFRLTPEQVGRASVAARWEAALTGTSLGVEHVRAGALAQNAAGLEKMARRIRPRVGWDDLVLAPAPYRQLRELVGRMIHRERVLGDWAMRPGGGRGRGVVALFAGESGTGKTMSAEVVAGALGLELYTINLATVVDKYVGETEKNLERIFSEVDGVNGVLLFDEADALFGKRSDVKDAHDRYANIEVAYLLQRIESFDGLAILATNLRANVDEAFTRRLDSLVDFPFPDVAQRLTLWQQSLGETVPLADDVDLAFVAESFELSGGNIRSIALTAAYLAADQGAEVTMADLVRAIHREYRKLGRLSVRSEFGQWYDAVAADIT